MDNQNSPKDIPMTTVIRGGSSVKAITTSLKKICKLAGIQYNQVYHFFHFDWNQSPPGSTQTGNEDESIANDEFLRAEMDTSSEVLADAEKDGLLWPAPDDFYRNPGSASDLTGATGKPPIGHTLAALNAEKLTTYLPKMMQAAQDYARFQEITKDGNRPEQPGRLPISVVISTVGAMGPGSLHWFVNQGIPFCSQQTAINTKVTIHLILRGNLSTQNPQAARLNEYITLKDLQCRASGQYVDPLTGCILPVPFSNCLLYSNVNAHGNFTDFTQLLYHQAHAEFFLWASPAGNLMRERACDIEGISYSKYGEPLCGQTLSISKLSRQSKRVIDFCTLMAVARFCQSLLNPGKGHHHIEQAVFVAQQEKLVESEDENLLTSDLIRPEEMGRENIIQQAHESLTDRISSGRGFQKAMQLDQGISDILNNDIDSLYIPAMKNQAKLRLESACQTLVKLLEQKLTNPEGLMEGLRVLSVLRRIVNNFNNALHEKSIQLQDYLTPHQMVLADASEQLGLLQQRNVIIRLFSFFLIRRIRISLQQSGTAAISHQLELSCCNIAEQDVFTPFLEFLNKKIAWLTSTLRKISNINQSCKIQASHLADEDTTSVNPNGYELTTSQYLENYLSEYVRLQGGLPAFGKELYGSFIKEYKSADIFLETPQSQLEEMLKTLFEPDFELAVEKENVWDEFEKTYPDLYTRQEMLTQLIRQSEGRVITQDSANQPVVWIKTVNVPDASSVGPVREQLEALDTKGGRWEVVVHPDTDSLIIGQLRGAITLSTFVRRLNIPDNELAWKSVAQHAVDIVSALMIPPNPSQHQFKRVLVKAIAVNLLTYKQERFYLQHADAEPLCLGADFSSAKKTLIKLWSAMVFIESTYARDLIVDEKHILDRLKDIFNSDDPRTSLIDQQAVHDCSTQTDIMLPRLRRVRVAAMREEQL